MGLENNNVVDEIIERLRNGHMQIFAERLVGFYLYGSLVWGDFDIDTSDIDSLCVLSSEITEEELERVRAMLDELVCDYPAWKNRLEIHYPSQSGLRNFRNTSFQMGNISPGEPLHMIEAGSDWLDEWYCVQEYAVSLCGIDKKELLPHISKEEFINTICGYALSFRERIRTCEDSCYSQAYGILTICRALYTMQSGEQTSKRKAAQFAVSFLPEYSELIKSALLWREERDQDSRNSEETYALAVRFVDDILDRFFVKS